MSKMGNQPNTPHKQKYGQPYRMPAPNKQSKKSAERKGRYAEHLTALWLSLKGYRLLEKRWKAKTGEIDLIARKGKNLVFVEVKLRRNHADAREAVTFQNRRRIEHTAALYLARKKMQPLPPCRFDIVTVSGLTLKHHRAAWREGE